MTAKESGAESRDNRGSPARSLVASLQQCFREDEGDAEYHDGVLVITLPKTDDAESRKIKVRS